MVFLSEAFTMEGALQSLGGGALIGSLAAMRLYCTRGLMSCATPVKWVTAGTIVLSTIGAGLSYSLSEPVPESASMLKFLLGGVLVGAGAKYGEGCTSGNGIQGMASFNAASWAHVLLFMGAAAITAPLTAASATHVTQKESGGGAFPLWPLVAVSVAGIAAQYARKRPKGVAPSESVVAATDLAAGLSFAASLAVSQMTKRSKVIGFLDFTHPTIGWDPSLMFVMGGGMAVTMVSYKLFNLFDDAHPHVQEWVNRKLDAKHAFGGILFGIGWGLTGFCPGPAMVSAGTWEVKAIAFTAAMFGTRLIMDHFDHGDPVGPHAKARKAGSRKKN